MKQNSSKQQPKTQATNWRIPNDGTRLNLISQLPSNNNNSNGNCPNSNNINSKKIWLSVLSFFATAVTLAWLPLLALMVTLSAPVTNFLAELFVDTTNSELSHDYLVYIANETRAYTLGDDNANLPIFSGVGLPDSSREYTNDVIAHLLDVRVVFQACINAFIIASIILLVCTITLALKHKYVYIARSLSQGATAVVALTVLIVILGVLNFNALFNAMHQVFFADGSWLFSYDSLLICALPEPFWIGCAIVLASTLLLFCTLAFVCARIIKYFVQHKQLVVKHR
jgi:integral membrane protein (TIGR01906 family)